MIPGKGIDSAELEPSGAEFGVGVPSESTDIGSYHLEAEHLGIEVISDGALQVFPGGTVVSRPVVPELTRTHRGATTDDEGTQALVF